ncbi:hypothetical protein M422DRAFT_273521 [Sphaerobolus stellatus SS14]|uniref:Uncharacterized protein n=1 Tax=Sphaerobolus stellatus (strain SS14) TaxID=990650 RepID=A0A0C9UJV5_SPHS4|nr:hypothetical protein M422DRAFT_273521 [Sphaerobolus stellatus SS14]
MVLNIIRKAPRIKLLRLDLNAGTYLPEEEHVMLQGIFENMKQLHTLIIRSMWCPAEDLTGILKSLRSAQVVNSLESVAIIEPFNIDYLLPPISTGHGTLCGNEKLVQGTAVNVIAPLLKNTSHGLKAIPTAIDH